MKQAAAERLIRPRLVGRNHKFPPHGQPNVLAKTLGEGALWESTTDPYARFEAEFLVPLAQVGIPCVRSILGRLRQRRELPDEFWGQLFIYAVEAARLSGFDVVADDEVTAVYAEAVECRKCAQDSKACDEPWRFALEGLMALSFADDLEVQMRRGLRGQALESWLAAQLLEQNQGPWDGT